ncbi:MAG: DUF1015 domain-containing protein [Bacteroides sp.]|nr:DUF1015 domain-containing protein [Eubacterium sp.]MCM1418929.1 DUF1015 domain-containing protein [Roseburia sp.]MCM1462127.1 DUF1015 domain-containing protein [Bacteroides sp.]
MNPALRAADILLPQVEEPEKWAVIACDQYTGQPEYWERVAEAVGSADSALKLILPEVYLEEEDAAARIAAIHGEMDRLLAAGRFREVKNTLVYIERTLADGAVRQGILGAIDLEEYDYRKGSVSQVRATEATVEGRLPARIAIREGAALELPHILMLIDDEAKSVIEPCAALASEGEPLYDFPLMEGGGRIRAYPIPETERERIFVALGELGDEAGFDRRYGLNGAPPLLFAVGDGNHSLAAAKEFYERLKRDRPGEDLSAHPARYALAEIVNLHSPALEFEAIHRIVKRVDPRLLIEEMTEALGLSEQPGEQRFTLVLPDGEREYTIGKPTSALTVGSLQNFLDDFRRRHGGKIDYIHGANVVRTLSKRPDAVGFLLPDMKKSELFPTVIKDGALPRKTFSMGRAEDKRFYIESRRIK